MTSEAMQTAQASRARPKCRPRSLAGAASHLRSITAITAAVLALSLAGCNAKLPDPDSPGARLYRERCNNCHRIYAPSLLKPEMWKYQVDRMQGEIARRGGPPLTEAERATVLEYLQSHAGK